MDELQTWKTDSNIQTLQSTESAQMAQKNEDSNVPSRCINGIVTISSIAIIGCAVIGLAPMITNSEFGKIIGSTLGKILPDIIDQKVNNSDAA